MAARGAEDLVRRPQVLGRRRSPSQPACAGVSTKVEREVPETWAQAFLATAWFSLKPVLTSGAKSCAEQHKERGQGMATLRRVSHQPDPPSQ